MKLLENLMTKSFSYIKKKKFLAFKGQKKGSHHFSFLFLSLLGTLFCLIYHDKLIY